MGDQRTKVTRDGHNYSGGIGLGFCVVVLVALVGIAVVYWFPPGWKVDHAGAYEGLGALFSGLAFIGVLYALKYQRDQLEDQRKAIAQQQTEMEAQRFETSFFQLLKFQRDSMQAMRVTIGPDSTFGLVGSAAFRHVVENLSKRFVIVFVPPLEGEQLTETVNSSFEQACFSDKSDFGHYFRTLYHLIEFVDKSPIEDKAYYAHLVRAQLSTDEIALLFYNGLSEQGGGFKPLIEKYALLKKWRIPVAFQSHKGLYADEAYGD
jgi:hypothetical protein